MNSNVVYHPKLGRYVYKHKGSGIMVDDIFKPLRKVASSCFKKIAEPCCQKKQYRSGISQAGEKLKKTSEKAGDIMKKLSSMRTNPKQNSKPKPKTAKMKRELTSIINV